MVILYVMVLRLTELLTLTYFLPSLPFMVSVMAPQLSIYLTSVVSLFVVGIMVVVLTLVVPSVLHRTPPIWHTITKSQTLVTSIVQHFPIVTVMLLMVVLLVVTLFLLQLLIVM